MIVSAGVLSDYILDGTHINIYIEAPYDIVLSLSRYQGHLAISFTCHIDTPLQFEFAHAYSLMDTPLEASMHLPVMQRIFCKDFLR